ncbi:MAG: nuclear transport factor 2 family protein [Halieaceae bacterium]|jgi:hypothetical protein|nr:nuclear transport factor 2 family protein [Halieaceae bacterium]
MTDLEQKVQRMQDLEDIRDLPRRYAHLVWQGKPIETVDLFCADGIVDLGPEDGGEIRGAENLRAIYSEKVGTDQMMLHPFVHNHVIDLNGDHASGTAYLDLRCIKDGESLMGSGYYEDQYIREQGKWKFKKRRLTVCYLVPPGQSWNQSRRLTDD